MDLHTYLDQHREAVLQLNEPLSVDQEITALQHALERRGLKPILRIENPRLADGTPSRFPVVTNLHASREITARALGVGDHRRFAETFQASAHTSGQAPGQTPGRAKASLVQVSSHQAPCREVVLEGPAVDITRLPALVQHELAPGPYFTAAHVATFDPDSGIDNMAIQRCWVREPRLMSLYTYPASHNARNVNKFWAKGRDCPVVLWIGHHPKVGLGAQAKLTYPESHWETTAAFWGAPLRLTPSLTHGERICVPAEAEIVIDGYIPAGRLEADGPFGEYSGYVGPQTLASVIEVTCLSHRQNAIYHDFGSGLADALIPDNMLMEAKLFGMVKSVAPSIKNVHVPVSGRRFHAYLQLEKPALGEARDALVAALAYRRVKTVVALDGDVDIFDDSEVMWALATRVQWHRDAIKIPSLSGSMLDPSMPAGSRTVTKLGVDATLPPSSNPGCPAPTPPRIAVREAAYDKAEAILDSLASDKLLKA